MKSYLICYRKYYVFNVHLMQNTTKIWEATRSDNNRPHGEENRVAHVQSQVINIHEFRIKHIDLEKKHHLIRFKNQFLTNYVHHASDYDIFLFISTNWTTDN